MLFPAGKTNIYTCFRLCVTMYIYINIYIHCQSLCKMLTKRLSIKMLIWVIFTQVKDKENFMFVIRLSVFVFVCMSVTIVTFVNYGGRGRLRDAIFGMHTLMIPSSYIMSSKYLFLA